MTDFLCSPQILTDQAARTDPGVKDTVYTGLQTTISLVHSQDPNPNRWFLLYNTTSCFLKARIICVNEVNITILANFNGIPFLPQLGLFTCLGLQTATKLVGFLLLGELPHATLGDWLHVFHQKCLSPHLSIQFLSQLCNYSFRKRRCKEGTNSHSKYPIYALFSCNIKYNCFWCNQTYILQMDKSSTKFRTSSFKYQALKAKL